MYASNTWTYSWDPDEPRLTRVQGPGGIDVSYSYDSAGRMLTRVSGGVSTTFEWDGWTLVKETTGSTVTRYVAPQGQLHSFERGGQVYQVHSDGHNGSVRAITDASGGAVAHYEFDAWGAQLGSSSPFSGGFAFGYVGSLGVRTDATTGLLYMRHRWFDPSGLQRFLSRDVLGSLNRYEYCYNNPVNWVDVDGLQPSSVGTWTDVHANPNRLSELVKELRTSKNYRDHPKSFDKIIKNIRFGKNKPSVSGQSLGQLIILNVDCNSDLSVVLLHELLHRANKLKMFDIVPKHLYSRGKTRPETMEADVLQHGINHAWIYVQTARFAHSRAQLPGQQFENLHFEFTDIYQYDQAMNPQGRLDNDPSYLAELAKFFEGPYDMYGFGK